jgi:hypothetical protein
MNVSPVSPTSECAVLETLQFQVPMPTLLPIVGLDVPLILTDILFKFGDCISAFRSFTLYFMSSFPHALLRRPRLQTFLLTMYVSLIILFGVKLRPTMPNGWFPWLGSERTQLPEVADSASELISCYETLPRLILRNPVVNISAVVITARRVFLLLKEALNYGMLTPDEETVR